MTDQHGPPVELLPIDALEPHPRNPNEGDVGAVADLLVHNGWFGTIEVQRRGGEQPLRILAGEHRWRAVRLLQSQGGMLRNERTGDRQLTYEELRAYHDAAGLPPMPPAGFIYGQVYAISDKLALRHLLADNESTRKGTYDRAILLDVLKEIGAEGGDLIGTAFDDDDLADLMEGLDAPTLDEVEEQLGGAHRDGELSPMIKVKVTQSTLDRWNEVFATIDGTNDESIIVLLDAYTASSFAP